MTKSCKRTPKWVWGTPTFFGEIIKKQILHWVGSKLRSYFSPFVDQGSPDYVSIRWRDRRLQRRFPIVDCLFVPEIFAIEMLFPARFRTTSHFDRKYLRNETRYRQSENGVANYDLCASELWSTNGEKYDRSFDPPTGHSSQDWR